MKRSAFASLCGVSKQQVSKYAQSGHLVLDGDEVDPVASLAALEGHLSEENRLRALQVLGGTSPKPAAGAQASSRPPARTGKALREDIEAELKALDLAERKGELVSAAEVDARAREAIALFREARANVRRETADKICAQFGIPADRAAALTRFLAQQDEHALGVFARAIAALADGEDELPTGVDAEPAAGAQARQGALL